MDHNLFIHSPTEGYPGYVQVMNKAVINIHVQVFVCTDVFHSFCLQIRFILPDAQQATTLRSLGLQQSSPDTRTCLTAGWVALSSLNQLSSN